jgi:hypothetical protein
MIPRNWPLRWLPRKTSMTTVDVVRLVFEENGNLCWGRGIWREWPTTKHHPLRTRGKFRK